MAVTWDSEKWLENNYIGDNGIPGFFIQGNYLPNQRDIAENEYRETVQLLGSSEVKECSEWAIKTINSGYLALSTTTSTNFWNNNLFRTNVIQSLLAPEAPRFVLSLPSDFESPQTLKASRKAKQDNNNTSNSRLKIDIVETDNITLPGLDVSLMSFLKTNAANKAYMYYNYDGESKYRITSVMNNILDLTDISANKKSYSLNGEQLDFIMAAFPITLPEYNNIGDGTRFEELLNEAYRNWSHALNKLYRILIETSSPEKLALYKICIHLVELQAENVNIFENEKKLSEGDFIIKVWGPILEKLFARTNVFLHWGDTLSVTSDDDSTKRRMDLRLLCKAGIDNYDIGEGEFGKDAIKSKLYSDKLKLIANGKKQLNCILEEYSGNPNEIKLCFIQVLGFEAELFQLWLESDGVYVLQKINQFSIPTISRRISKDLKQFVDGLSMLRALVLELTFVCADNQKRLGKMKALTNAPQPNQRTVWNRPLWSPPPPPPKATSTTSS